MSPVQGSEEDYTEEAERLYALNPSWQIQEAETKLPSLQPSAAKLSHRKRTGKHIQDERRLALTPCLRPSRTARHPRVGIKAENRAYCTRQRGKRKNKSKGQPVMGENHSIESAWKYHLSIHGNQFTFSQTRKAQISSSSERHLKACGCVRFLTSYQINSANKCLEYKNHVPSLLKR